MEALGCGHIFCSNCWRQYLTVKIVDEAVADSIPCAATGCDLVMDDDIVLRLLRDKPRVIDKYHFLISNCYVEVGILSNLHTVHTGRRVFHISATLKKTYCRNSDVKRVSNRSRNVVDRLSIYIRVRTGRTFHDRAGRSTGD